MNDSSKLQALRVKIRNNNKKVIDYIVRNHIIRDEEDNAIISTEESICMFCGTENRVTREHVIPRWIFTNGTSAHFNITLNEHDQAYEKTTIPACNICNAELLNSLERYVQYLFTSSFATNTEFTNEEAKYIVRWLEVIDYKFHILNITKKFLSPKNGEHIPYLRDFPLYLLLPNKDYSVSQAIAEVRRTLTRISIKDKTARVNSLIVFKTTNKAYHFFHSLNEFIFFELPEYGIAMFYFYNRTFPNQADAHHEAMKAIKEVY